MKNGYLFILIFLSFQDPVSVFYPFDTDGTYCNNNVYMFEFSFWDILQSNNRVYLKHLRMLYYSNGTRKFSIIS